MPHVQNSRKTTRKPESELDASPKPIQNRWAFLVGVNRYAENKSFGDLNYCVNDVTALEKVLEQVGYTAICLHDGLEARDRLFPSLQNVQRRFSELSDRVGPDDLLLVYFACHGTRQGDGKPRLILQDTWPKDLDETALAIAQLEDWMRGTEAQRLVMMLDACHIGLGTDQRAVADPEFIRNVYELAMGFELIAASTDEQAAYELGGMQHGLFSYFVLSGLIGEAKQDDELVTVGSLRHYVLNGMAKKGLKEGIPQDPRLRKEGSLGDMILVDYRIKGLPSLSLKIDNLGEKGELRSLSSLDYKHLDYLLRSEKWGDADQETHSLMLKALNGRKFWAEVPSEDISAFPHEDLKTIDRLWSEYSGGKFGFSVQTAIYIKAQAENSRESWERFGEKVGWKTKHPDEWVIFNEIQFKRNAPKGHLPTILFGGPNGFERPEFNEMRPLLMKKFMAL